MEKNPNPKGERLQVVLARFGVASRRGVVSMIEAGEVLVNGKVVKEKGYRVAPTDHVSVEGKTFQSAASPRKRYFLFYKPRGVMTTLQDPNAERTVADFFGNVEERLFPVGRLDRDTTGVLLMTNDGELAFRLTHPKFGVEKKYRAAIRGFVSDEEITRLEKGVRLEEGETAPCKIQLIQRNPKATELFVWLHEGKKRQIRRIFQKIGHFVSALERENFGPLGLGDMKPGEKRELRPGEVKALKRAASLK